MVSEALLRQAPVVFFVFDLLLVDGRALLELSLRERLCRLETLIGAEGTIRLADRSVVVSAADIDRLFDAARARGNEGLVVKDPQSAYSPGRRGRSWLKYKKALATLDCVVTAVEYGHGKRRGVLSDYTFAVRRGEELVNIGKAFTGLTDAEIERMTSHFKSITVSRHGPVHVVQPEIVVEIAFDRIQESPRHKSGYALRFPRIVRLRDDKTVAEVSTIDEVRTIYVGQLRREEGKADPAGAKRRN
jgi:DNA ligase 1